MRRWVVGGLLGVALTVVAAGPASAQRWPGYGDYGYGSGYDYVRNPYSYPRPPYAQSPSVPSDVVSLYGGYMPNSYYTGAAYVVNRAFAFPSGQAFCQAAGSYLYCADIESGPAYLLGIGDGDGGGRRDIRTAMALASERTFTGVLATRSVGDTAELVGTLRGPDGEEVALSCSGRAGPPIVNLTCR
jgi:hypothetical protein